MLKNAYFVDNCKNLLSVGGSAPEPSRCYSRLLLQLCTVRFWRILRFIASSKKQ